MTYPQYGRKSDEKSKFQIPVSSTSYNLLVMTKPQYGRKSDKKRNSKIFISSLAGGPGVTAIRIGGPSLGGAIGGIPFPPRGAMPPGFQSFNFSPAGGFTAATSTATQSTSATSTTSTSTPSSNSRGANAPRAAPGRHITYKLYSSQLLITSSSWDKNICLLVWVSEWSRYRWVLTGSQSLSYQRVAMYTVNDGTVQET